MRPNRKASAFSPIAVAVLAAVFVLLGCAQRHSVGEEGEALVRPNVLFVSVDDMNDWLGALESYPGVYTPNIDRLAARGRLFTNAHTPSPLCNPARTAILTGRLPSTTGIYNNGNWWRPALPDVTTIPQHFKAQGYNVLGAGKIFHHTAGFDPPDQWDERFQIVFDDSWDRPPRLNPWVEPTDPPPGHPLSGVMPVKHERDWGVLDKDEAAYGDAQAVDWAIERLGERYEDPFFLAVGLFHPHLPWYTPQSYFDLYPDASVRVPEAPANDLDDLPSTGQAMAAFRREDLEVIGGAGKLEEAVQAYLASISFADAQIGRLLNALNDSGHADKTIIIFWSDHGYHLGEKQHWSKSTLWERSTRVPLIIFVPGLTAAGQSSNPVGLIDIYPTLIDLCSLDPVPGLDGRSLLPVLQDASYSEDRPVVTTFGRGNHAVRSARYRYIRYYDGGEELYDHESDPNEWTNLASRADLADVIKDLRRWIPQKDALEAPGKNKYRFDYASYKWESQ